MQTAVRRMGNSAGIILPKPLLAELGIQAGDAVSLTLEEGRLILTPARRHPREGWAEASKALAASGDDARVWPEFGNDGDDELTW